MSITIWRREDKYEVSVSPPEGPLWRSSQPMSSREILDKLIGMGCHSTDIRDAFDAADPFWTEREGA
jgi:hypothetical protein